MISLLSWTVSSQRKCGSGLLHVAPCNARTSRGQLACRLTVRNNKTAVTSGATAAVANFKGPFCSSAHGYAKRIVSNFIQNHETPKEKW